LKWREPTRSWLKVVRLMLLELQPRCQEVHGESRRTRHRGGGEKRVQDVKQMPLCRSEDITTRGRFFKCLSCGLEANRNAVGVLNMGRLHGDGVNEGVAHPLLLGGME